MLKGVLIYVTNSQKYTENKSKNYVDGKKGVQG